MPYKYVCSDSGLTCDVQYVDEEEEKVRAQAEEHIRTDHPEEAVNRDRANALLLGGFKPA